MGMRVLERSREAAAHAAAYSELSRNRANALIEIKNNVKRGIRKAFSYRASAGFYGSR
jgi:hypothetical protein